MSAAGIYLDINGELVDLDDATWYEKAPCGCVCGATVAYSDYGPAPARVIATAEQAADEFWETKHERAKYEALGFTVFADHRAAISELMAGDCPHEPRYGIPPRPQVQGYSWAAVHDITSRPKLMHLVPDGAIEDATERRYGSDRGVPLCGGKRAFWWSTEWYALDGKVECSRCVKRAQSAAVA